MLTRFIEALFLAIYQLFTHRRRPAGRHTSATIAQKLATGVVIGRMILSPLDRARLGPDAPEELLLTDEERSRHLYLIGGTGSGKTNLTLTIVQADISSARAVCLIDARGDLIDRVLIRLAANPPPDLDDRLVLLDLRQAYSNWAVPCNPLAEVGRDPYARTAFVLSVLKQTYEIGVQTEEATRNALLALSMLDPPYSLLEVEPLLTIPAFRERVLAQVSDAAVLRYFRRYDALGAGQSTVIAPVLNKLTPLLAQPVLRNCLGQRAGLPLRQMLRERRDLIFLVSLAADELYGAAGLMGSLLMSAMASAVMRTDLPEAQRIPVRLYADEFENLLGASETLEAMIQEGRRFGLGLTLSHQSLVQLPARLQSLIRNVCGSQVIFGTGAIDSEALAQGIASDDPKPLIRNLIQNQKTGEAFVVRRGKPPVRIRTAHNPDPDVDIDKVNALREKALGRFGHLRNDIETEFAERERHYEAGTLPTLPRAPRSKRPSSAAHDSAPDPNISPVGNTSIPKPIPQQITEVRDHDPDAHSKRKPRRHADVTAKPSTQEPQSAPAVDEP